MEVVNLLVGAAIVVGLVGIVLPVLPGSLLIGAAVLVWALEAQTTGAWLVLAAAVVLLVAGNLATYVITGRRVTAAGVPRRSLIAAGLAGIVGFFVLPVVGLVLFFAVGLLLAEYRRLGDLGMARRSAGIALRATALGLLVELALALAAASTWLVAVLNGVGG